MRRYIAIIGTLLIATILFSGPAVAASHYIEDVVYEWQCTNPDNAEGIDDGNYATIGENGFPDNLGQIMLDFGEGNEMGVGQNFTVYTGGGEIEYFKTWILKDVIWEEFHYMGNRSDQSNQEFTIPPGEPGTEWRYVCIEGATGLKGGGDTIYGPEIDAVGWED